jgi:RNA polymerase sigma-70 factor (ECF subfamily)
MSGESALKRSRKRRGDVHGLVSCGDGKSQGAATEDRLIEAAQRDPRHFAELYENNFARVYAFVARRVDDRDQAQDVTADVFCSALKNLDRFEWRGVPFVAWLFRIARNAIADRGQRAGKRKAVESREIPALLEQTDQVDLDETEYRARLFTIVDKLPQDQRRVIAMRFAHEKSIAEIAKELGRSEGAIKQLQFRGLQGLRKMVGER